MDASTSTSNGRCGWVEKKSTRKGKGDCCYGTQVHALSWDRALRCSHSGLIFRGPARQHDRPCRPGLQSHRVCVPPLLGSGHEPAQVSQETTRIGARELRGPLCLSDRDLRIASWAFSPCRFSPGRPLSPDLLPTAKHRNSEHKRITLRELRQS